MQQQRTPFAPSSRHVTKASSQTTIPIASIPSEFKASTTTPVTTSKPTTSYVASASKKPKFTLVGTSWADIESEAPAFLAPPPTETVPQPVKSVPINYISEAVSKAEASKKHEKPVPLSVIQQEERSSNFRGNHKKRHSTSPRHSTSSNATSTVPEIVHPKIVQRPKQLQPLLNPRVAPSPPPSTHPLPISSPSSIPLPTPIPQEIPDIISFDLSTFTPEDDSFYSESLAKEAIDKKKELEAEEKRKEAERLALAAQKMKELDERTRKKEGEDGELDISQSGPSGPQPVKVLRKTFMDGRMKNSKIVASVEQSKVECDIHFGNFDEKIEPKIQTEKTKKPSFSQNFTPKFSENHESLESLSGLPIKSQRNSEPKVNPIGGIKAKQTEKGHSVLESFKSPIIAPIARKDDLCFGTFSLEKSDDVISDVAMEKSIKNLIESNSTPVPSEVPSENLNENLSEVPVVSEVVNKATRRTFKRRS
ncbi:hypothetical protein RCL1_007597 [Eukaryota sp. TZLM3-RCL]